MEEHLAPLSYDNDMEHFQNNTMIKKSNSQVLNNLEMTYDTVECTSDLQEIISLAQTPAFTINHCD